MAGLADLAKYMIDLGMNLPSVGNEGKKDTAMTIMNDLLQVTPVDTGKAVSNWKASIDVPDLTVTDAFAPSPKGRTRNGVWEHRVDPDVTALANIPSTLQAAQEIIAAALPGQPIFISNGVEYIEKLNSGSSNQAPVGFVDRAIILGGAAANRIRVAP